MKMTIFILTVLFFLSVIIMIVLRFPPPSLDEEQSRLRRSCLFNMNV